MANTKQEFDEQERPGIGGDPIVRIRDKRKGVRYIRLSEWKLELVQARGRTK